MQEPEIFTAGDETVTIDTECGKFGLATCYDLRFPELFRKLALFGVEAIVIPAQWPCVRAKHWRTLLKARAIENQLFIIGTNRIGSSPNDDFCGPSLIIDPIGEVLAEIKSDIEDIATATIDLGSINQIRKIICYLDDRKPELY